MASTLRERRRQMLRDEILTAAQELIAEKGYSAMSMDELAARVGISKPTLYSHFDAKEKVAVEVVLERLDWMLERVEAPPPGLSPLQHLTLLVRTIAELDLTRGKAPLQTWSPELFQVICGNARALERLRGAHEEIRALAQRGIDAGEIDPALSADVVALAFYSIATALKASRLGLIDAPGEGAADMLATIFERGMRRDGVTEGAEAP